ncbi:MAG: eukaryotic-like serine/threonine-protein kinase, partial [Actinomycetota bacterium]|nr:eukaryotic-like serine/threonine-protein kinase [Actinomycetota bacterium]
MVVALAVVVVVAAAIAVVSRQGAEPAAASSPVPRPCSGAVTRRGCSTLVSWHAPLLVVEGARYRLGQPGDVLILGDWSCTGHDDPALYRPASGEVFLFSGWAAGGQPMPAATRQATGRLHGLPNVVRGRGGCDRIVVVK